MYVELKKVAIIYNFSMKKKYLIFGATGSIGSSLANQMYKEKKDCNLLTEVGVYFFSDFT